MTSGVRRSEAVTASENHDVAAAVRAEIERYRDSGDLGDGIRVEPRCRVCSNVSMRSTINKMLAYGMTYRDILESVQPINATLPKNRRVSYRSIWSHARTHFRVDQPAQAVYRSIVERRAAESDVDIVEGVQTLVNAYSYLETMMVKGFRNLVDDDTTVSPVEGMNAAMKLREVMREDADASGGQMTDLMHQMDRIVSAVRSVVPEEYHAAILAHLDGEGPPGVIDAETTDAPDEDDILEIDPGVEHDERDELED